MLGRACAFRKRKLVLMRDENKFRIPSAEPKAFGFRAEPSRERELRWPRTEPIRDPQDRFQRDTCSVSPRQRYTEVGQARPGPSPALPCVVEESCGCTSHPAAHLSWDSAGPFEKCSTAGWEVGTGRRGSCPGGGGSGMRPPSRWPLRALPGPPAVPYLHYINNGLNALINTC